MLRDGVGSVRGRGSRVGTAVTRPPTWRSKCGRRVYGIMEGFQNMYLELPGALCICLHLAQLNEPPSAAQRDNSETPPRPATELRARWRSDVKNAPWSRGDDAARMALTASASQGSLSPPARGMIDGDASHHTHRWCLSADAARVET
jgi:hypothetical protein